MMIDHTHSKTSKAITVIIIFVLGLLAGLFMVIVGFSRGDDGVTVASGSGQSVPFEEGLVEEYLRGDVIPPEKQAAMDSIATEPEVPAVNNTVPQVPVSGDKGDPATIDEIKRELVVLEERLSSSYEMPSPLQRGALTGDKSSSHVQMRSDIEARTLGAISEVFVSAEVAEREQQASRAIQVAYDDPQYRGFSDSRFVVDRWHGVHVEGSTATAVLEAHQEYLVNAEGVDGTREWLIDPVRRWQVHLQYQDGGWRVVEQAQHSMTGQG